MKKITYLLLVTLLNSLGTMAQNGLSGTVQPFTGIPGSTDINVWFVLERNDHSKEMISPAVLISSSNVQKLELLKVEEAAKRFGVTNPTQVWIITPKPSARIISLSEYYQLQKLSSELKKLPIMMIDGELISDTTNVLIDINSIGKLKFNFDSVSIISTDRATRLKMR
jgi:hypothetical protein